ncbi:MAG: MMPL family transporter [Dehalococcoidia bacterium]
MFGLLGRYTYRLRWPLIVAFVLLFLGGIAYGAGVIGDLVGAGFQDPNSESARSQQTLIDRLGVGTADVVAVFSSPGLTADDPAFAQQVQSALDRVAADPVVVRVTSFYTTGADYFVSLDGRKTFAVVEMAGTDSEKLAAFPRLKSALRSTQLSLLLGGEVPANQSAQDTVERDLQRAELLSLPLVAVLLLLFFGGLVAAGVPLLVGGFAIAMALAFTRLLAQFTDVSIFALNIITLMGLGLAVDYSLFLVNRFREELAAGRSADTAVANTLATAGKAVAFSGLAVAVSLLGLLFFPVMFLRSMAIGGALVVLLALVGALVVLPAVLSVLGPRINSLSFRRKRPQAQASHFWHRIATAVMRRPLVVAALVLVVLLAMGTPFLRIQTSVPDARIFPPQNQVRQVYELLHSAREFPPNEITPVQVAVTTDGPILSPVNVGALYDYVQTIQELPGVRRVDSIVSVAPSLTRDQYQAIYSRPDLLLPQQRQRLSQFASGDTTIVSVVSDFAPLSPQAQQQLQAIRSLPTGDLHALVGGITAQLIDVRDAMLGMLPFALAFVAGVTLVVLFLAFGSLVVPLKAIVMNVLSLTASFGALVWIFQDGHLEGLLRFQSLGSIDLTMPVLMFAIVFGLSMDYEVFLLSRIKEEYDRTGHNRLSVATGLEKTGRIITSAAAILVVVIAAFATSSMIFIKELGVGMALAIAVDATIVRALLVPAAMQLLGRANWWAPAPLRRAWQRLGVGVYEGKATAATGTDQRAPTIGMGSRRQ